MKEKSSWVRVSPLHHVKAGVIKTNSRYCLQLQPSRLTEQRQSFPARRRRRPYIPVTYLPFWYWEVVCFDDCHSQASDHAVSIIFSSCLQNCYSKAEALMSQKPPTRTYANLYICNSTDSVLMQVKIPEHLWKGPERESKVRTEEYEESWRLTAGQNHDEVEEYSSLYFRQLPSLQPKHSKYLCSQRWIDISWLLMKNLINNTPNMSMASSISLLTATRIAVSGATS